MNKVDYKTIIELGFMVEPSHDSIYEQQHGIPYTLHYIDITKKLHVSWDQIDRELSLYVKGNFNRKITLEELHFLLEIYGK